MAVAEDDQQGDERDATEASHGQQECMPCGGTGQVISGLGGKPNKIACPWCQGQGTRQYGIDAQARWLEGEAQSGGGGDEPAGAAA
jgi:DnaJ-class molecular chaperone